MLIFLFKAQLYSYNISAPSALFPRRFFHWRFDERILYSLIKSHLYDSLEYFDCRKYCLGCSLLDSYHKRVLLIVFEHLYGCSQFGEALKTWKSSHWRQKVLWHKIQTYILRFDYCRYWHMSSLPCLATRFWYWVPVEAI